MNTSRIANTKRNIIWSYIDYFISIIFSFASRTIIVYILGAEYLGLSSLYSSILQVLNMTELGFSSAIIFNLYKPLAEKNDNAVCALLSFYKKIYRIVGIIILVIGLSISPFLKLLIKGSVPADINLYILYYLYLANTTVSYFVFAYKASLLNAVQRMDLTKIAYSIVNISQCLLQLLVLYIFKNYYLFVVVTIVGTVSKNILASIFANKYFPQYQCRGTISETTRKDIWKRVKGLLVGNVSSVTYTTFDSIILSTMIGLIPVAIYNNYLTIYSTIANIIVLIRHAMQASVGNSVASESLEKNHKDVVRWQFLFSMIAIWCSAALMCLYQPFMKLWMGEKMLLSMFDVCILSTLFAVSTVQQAFYLYLSGFGLWWSLRWPYIVSTITNLVLNVVLCKIWGISGVIFATLFAQTVFGLIWQSIIVFREYFRRSAVPYLLKQLKYIILGALICILCYFICSLIRVEGILDLLIRALICAILPPICLVSMFYRTEEFAESKELIRKVIKQH